MRIFDTDYLRSKSQKPEACRFAFDVGALRYCWPTSTRDLNNDRSDLFQWFSAGRSISTFNHRVSCLAIPGRIGYTSDGVVDIATESGLSQSSLYELRQEKVFQIDRERWLIGYLPTINYQATVTIYQLGVAKSWAR
jgi:hypothetical protein